VNSLERSLITKTGYDHGWEVVVDEATPDRLILGSALHRGQAQVSSAGESGDWLVSFPAGALCDELRRIRSLRSIAADAFAAKGERELGELLGHAARLARTLPDLPCREFERKVSEELSRLAGPPSATEVERMVRQRVGQDIYRQSLLDYWGGACAVTGITIPELLRASHIKPWSECETDAERLNVFNGFLLAAHLDALFDRHLMTFDTEGMALFSPRIDAPTRSKLGLAGPLRLRWLSPEHEGFLAGHRVKLSP
jgi:putative restriction endonuclease